MIVTNDGSTPQPSPLPVVVGETVPIAETFPFDSVTSFDIALDCDGTPVPLNPPTARHEDSPIPPLLRDTFPVAFDVLGNFEVPIAAENTDILCTWHNTRQSAALTLAKGWVDATGGDSAALSITGFNTATATAIAPTGTGPSPQTATALVFGGETVDLSEVLGTNNTDQYATTLTCTDAAGLTYTNGASAGTYTMPQDPVAVTCTFTNTRLMPGSLAITKTVSSGPTRNPDGTDTLAYDITVSNPGQLPIPYTLTDELLFASGVVVTTVAAVNLVPGDIPVNPAFNGTTDQTIASSQLTGGGTTSTESP